MPFIPGDDDGSGSHCSLHAPTTVCRSSITRTQCSFRRERFASAARWPHHLRNPDRSTSSAPSRATSTVMSRGTCSISPPSWALDFFTSGDTVATVSWPPAAPLFPETGEARAFCVLNEIHPGPTSSPRPGSAPTASPGAGRGHRQFEADGESSQSLENVPRASLASSSPPSA